MIHICSQCKHTESSYKGKCPKCGAWNCMRVKDSRTQTRTEARSLVPIRATDVPSVAEVLYPTGIGAWDRALGGGMGNGSILCAGEPGVGKSTHAIYAACNVAAQLNGDALFLSGEMQASLAVTSGRRVGADLARMVVYETDSVDTAEAICLLVRPVVVVWDSLQAFLCTGGSDGMAVEVARRAIAVGMQLNCQTWLISQLNKDGEPEGRRRIQHAVDTVFGLEKGKVTVGKNRFAPGNKEEPWFFGEMS